MPRRTASAIGIAFLLTACVGTPSSSPAPTARATPDPSAAPIATPTPTQSLTPAPSPILGDIRWTELEADPMPMLHDLVSVDGGYIGVGSMSSGEGEATTPAIWTSPNGATWTGRAVNDDPDGALWGDMPFTQVVLHRDLLIAVASGPGVFVSDAPERAWSHRNLGEGACPGWLASDGDSVVTVGAIGACGLGGATRPGAWVSDDGVTWEPAELGSSGTGGGWFSGVIGTPAGYIGWGRFLEQPICDVGCEVDQQTDPFAGAPWISSDGANWQRIEQPEPFEDSLVEQVVTIGDVYLAVGWRGQGDATVRALWRSTDGLAWEMVRDELPFLHDPSDPSEAPNLRISGGAPALVAWSIGVTGTALWYSFDGLTWKSGPTLPGHINEVKVLDGVLVAIGTREETDPGITPPCTKDQVVSGRCRTVPVVWIGQR